VARAQQEDLVRRLKQLLFTHRNRQRPRALAAHTLEVVVQWGHHSILHVAHSSPPRAFHVGDGSDDNAHGAHDADGGEQDAPAIDFALDRSLLGCDRLPLVLVEGEDVRVLLPAGASAQLQLGDACIDAHELAAQGKLQPVAAQPGAHSFALAPGASARVALGALVFTLTLGSSEPGPALAQQRALDWKAQRWTFASFVAHGALLALFMFLPPTSNVLAAGELDSSSRLIGFMLDARERPPEPPIWTEPAAEGGSDPGERAKDEEGSAGALDAPPRPTRGEASGRAPRRTLPVATAAAPDLATTSILGMIRSAQVNASTVFTGAVAEGNALRDVFGGLHGDLLGASYGRGGMGMTGPGRGGGGDASGSVGSGPLGTIGSGSGGHGPGSRYGRGAGRFSVRDPRVPPPVTALQADIRGSLSKETIRRVIHRHLAEVRACYEQRLISRPDLQGRVAVRFIIAPNGMVQAAVLDSSELGDPGTEQCVVRAVRRWPFPQPEGGGIVTVTYPFLLQQTGG
jgi:TonB family protein